MIYITPTGSTTIEDEFVLETIKYLLDIDRSQVYGYKFKDLFIDYTKDQSIINSINEIIDIMNLNATIVQIDRLIDRIIVQIKVNNKVEGLVING